jgi:hypothetical protein
LAELIDAFAAYTSWRKSFWSNCRYACRINGFGERAKE